MASAYFAMNPSTAQLSSAHMNQYSNPTPPESVMDDCSPPPTTINPHDIAHEPTLTGDMSSRATSVSAPTNYHPAPTEDGSCEPPKKKRKSWGQVLPKPTTNLPPRKRAKTDEEKAQRKYERVQRNRHAAHMSRMRKQDEMENLRIENDRLRIDNTDLENEIKRLREELASRPNASSNKVFNSSIKTEAGSRPMTPPNSHQQSMLHSENSSPPQSMPSLTYSPSEPSLDLDAQQSLFTHIPASLDPSTINPADLKCSDDSRSAATCSLQWTPDTSTISAGSLKTRRSRRIQSREEDG